MFNWIAVTDCMSTLDPKMIHKSDIYTDETVHNLLTHCLNQYRESPWPIYSRTGQIRMPMPMKCPESVRQFYLDRIKKAIYTQNEDVIKLYRCSYNADCCFISLLRVRSDRAMEVPFVITAEEARSL